MFDKIKEKHAPRVQVSETHVQAALSMADRGYVLEAGTIMLDGSGAAMLDDERVRASCPGRRAGAA